MNKMIHTANDDADVVYTMDDEKQRKQETMRKHFVGALAELVAKYTKADKQTN